MIIWLTGNSGSGKTTLARKLTGKNTIVLDGDVMRQVWPQKLTLSKEDRWKQGLGIARLAKELESQGFCVVVSVIAPYKDLRREIETICGCKWFHVPGGKTGEDYPYETPDNPHIRVDK